MSSNLSHVYWIGGGSGAGKSTIAQSLAKKYDLYYYSTDDAMRDHGPRCSKETCPYLTIFQNMDMDERWVLRSPQEMLDTFHWYQGEGFNLIIEDLQKLPNDRGIIAEGFRLLPNLVKPWLNIQNQAVWLIPTSEFRLNAFKSRGTLWDIANKTSNPQRALDNLLTRDGLFTDRLYKELQDVNLPIIKVTPEMKEDYLLKKISKQFGFVSS